MIRFLAIACTALALGACSAPRATFPDGPERHVKTIAGDRAAERAVESAPVPQDRVDDFGTYRDDAAERMLDEKIAAALAREIQERDAEDRRLEAEVEIARARAEAIANYRAADPYRARRYARRDDRSAMPWNTLFYGGLGAVIGHQYGKRDRGLAIGAGFGLLQDALRWRW